MEKKTPSEALIKSETRKSSEDTDTMDAEKSSSSSFEDLSNLNEADMKASQALLNKEGEECAKLAKQQQRECARLQQEESTQSESECEQQQKQWAWMAEPQREESPQTEARVVLNAEATSVAYSEIDDESNAEADDEANGEADDEASAEADDEVNVESEVEANAVVQVEANSEVEVVVEANAEVQVEANTEVEVEANAEPDEANAEPDEANAEPDEANAEYEDADGAEDADEAEYADEAEDEPEVAAIARPEPVNGMKASPDDNYEFVDVLGNGQLMKRVIQKSPSGQRPKRGDLVTISFTGWLKDSEEIVEKANSMKIHVGDYEVVQGLDMAIPLMNTGEVAEVILHPRFAYSSIGLKNEEDPALSIPPEATIRYVVHLLARKYEDFSDLKNFKLRHKYGNAKKERANFWYNRNEFNTAIQLYRRALDYLDDRDGDPNSGFNADDIEVSNSDLQVLLNDRLIVYNNLAMAQIKVSAFDAALKSVEHVLRCQPNNSKALYRKGRILEGQGNTKGAISMLQKAATLESDSKSIQQDLAKLIIKARREEHNEKEMYQKMLGQAKKLEQKNKLPQKQQNAEGSKLKMLGYLMGSILIGVAGVAIYRYKY